jgi:hypothetical protein
MDPTVVFALFAVALKRCGLARTPNGPVDYAVDAGEFMYMNTAKGHHYFKHCASRNYVLTTVAVRGDAPEGFVVPVTERPFFRGEFPADPS